ALMAGKSRSAVRKNSASVMPTTCCGRSPSRASPAPSEDLKRISSSVVQYTTGNWSSRKLNPWLESSPMELRGSVMALAFDISDPYGSNLGESKSIQGVQSVFILADEARVRTCNRCFRGKVRL